MQLNELYLIQAGLKSRIGYDEPDKFEKMMLAMIIEFSEAANDWQGFKYWKKNNKPKETLLEEYVDGLHFVLEAGIDLLDREEIMRLPKRAEAKPYEKSDVTEQFKTIIADVLDIDYEVKHGTSYLDLEYVNLFENYLTLGAMLGFTEDQIAAAYLKKVAINHERQDNGY
jgi:dimeric dUTPase (all-alpha-NTP-PPase superfamily)